MTAVQLDLVDFIEAAPLPERANADAKQLKAQPAAEIIGTLNRQGLSVRQGAKLARVDPADIQRIRNADLSRFTVDRLLHILAAAA